MKGMEVLPKLTWMNAWVPHVTWVSIVLLVGLNAYVLAARKVRTRGIAWPRARTISASACALALWLATNSVVGAYDMTLFSMHMVQHLLVVMVAAACLAGAAPVDLVRGLVAGRAARVLEAVVTGPIGRTLDRPQVAFVLYAATIPAFHLTNLFDVAMRSGTTHAAEEVLFLVVGYLFWRPVVAVERTRHPLAPGLRIVYLLLSVPVDTFTGLSLMQTTSVGRFADFATGNRHWGPSVLEDVHQGAAIMWIFGDLIMMAAMVPAALAWLRQDRAEASAIDAALDAGAAPEAPRSAWAPRQQAVFPTITRED
jgi:putative copper resistance protein D